MFKGIPSSAFYKSTITSVKFGSKCTSVDNDAFRGCISLSEINDNNVIEKIGFGAFAETNLISVRFSKLTSVGVGLTSNAVGVFENCENLKYVNISNCKYVANRTFSNCINLSQINIPMCSNIGDGAFLGCSKISNFNFRNCTAIGDEAFKGCVSLEKANLINCTGTDSKIAIGKSAFADCKNLKQISLTYCNKIDDSAFFNCSSLSRVYINAQQNISRIDLGSKVFYYSTKSNNQSIIENIRFYIESDMYSTYTENNDSNPWKPYINYIYEMAGENQILYTTTDNKKIDILDDINNNEYIYHTYENSRGSIIFKKNIEILNQNIFKEEAKAKLKSIILPKNCNYIGDNVFEGCTSLNEIILPPNLQYISNYAFKDCESLDEFTIPDTIKELGEGIFVGCKNIKKFEGKFVTYGGNAVVYDNTLICVLPNNNNDTDGLIYKISDIDSGIKKLGKACFYGNKNVRRVDISPEVIWISDDTFSGCDNLREVHFSKNPTELGTNVFGNIENLVDFKIFVPENYLSNFINVWDNNDYISTNYISYVYPKPNDNCIIYYGSKRTNSTDRKETYPYTNGEYYKINNVGKTVFENYFSNNTSIDKIILGENITQINKWAFKNCKSLEYIYIPDTINKFGNECFYNCEKLIRIHIPNSNYIQQTQTINSKSTKSNINIEIGGIQNFSGSTTYFGDNIFYGCTSLKEFGSYHKGFVSDDNMCYVDCGILRFFAQGGLKPIESDGPSDSESDGTTSYSYTIPDNVTEINKYTFNGVKNINNITISKSTKIIGENAFADCSNLTSINGWDDVEIISNHAFESCSNIGEISFPKSVVELGEYAFAGCSNINTGNNSLELSKLTVINKFTFAGCERLTNVNINDNITTICESAFIECTKLENVILNTDSSLSSIENNAFNNCSNLNIFNLPNNLKNIGDNAFFNCGNIEANGNKILSIPNSVNTIGSYCFSKSGIGGLEISEDSELEIISDGAFSECSSISVIDISSAKNINRIGKKSFYNCKNLKCKDDDSILLPVNVKIVDDSAFEKCKLIKNVTLPSTSNNLKLGHLCLATGKNSTTINVPAFLFEPPVFIMNNENNIKSCPFGDPTNNTNIPKISILASFKLKYSNNIYWRKYAMNFYTVGVIK